MDAAGHSANSSEPPPHRWANLLGSAIALMTLMLPALAIAYYSTTDLTAFDQPPGLIPTWSQTTMD